MIGTVFCVLLLLALYGSSCRPGGATHRFLSRIAERERFRVFPRGHFDD